MLLAAAEVMALPQVVATVPLISPALSVAVNPSTNRVYVANCYDTRVLSVLDGATNAVIATVPIGRSMLGVAASATTNRVYVANPAENTVTVVDGTDNRIVATVAVGSFPQEVAVNQVTNRVYVSNEWGHTVSVIDEAAGGVIATIPTGHSPQGMAINETSNRVYVANAGSQTVTVIDGASNSVVASVPVGASPQQAAVDPVTDCVYVANVLSGTVSVIDGASNTIGATIPTGSYPRGVAVDPATHLAYVANQNDNNVVVIGGASNSVVGSIAVGNCPQGVAINPVTHCVYALNLNDATLSVIADPSGTWELVGTHDVYYYCNSGGTYTDPNPYHAWYIQPGPIHVDAGSGTYKVEVLGQLDPSNVPGGFRIWDGDTTGGTQYSAYGTPDVFEHTFGQITLYFHDWYPWDDPPTAGHRVGLYRLVSGPQTNDPPVAQDQTVTTGEDSPAAIMLSATDPNGDALTYTVVAGPAHGTLTGTAPILTYTPASDYSGADSFTFTADDGQADSNTATVSITVTSVNDAPVATDDSYSTDEDQPLTGAAPGMLGNDADADGDTLTAVKVSDPANGTVALDADGSFTYTPNANWNGTDTFTYKANDGQADSNVATVTITVNPVNDPPVVGAITAPTAPVEVNTEVQASAEFSDPDVGDTHTATWDWGDGSTSDGTIAGGTARGSHAYAVPGVYTVKLTVSDGQAESSAEYRYVVVYDPEGGFVTGAGWIDSPEGAYAPDPTLTGKATFGFVAKYKKGATVPDGQAEFHFRVAQLNFHSTAYEWLVVAGAKAQFKGTGTINGAGTYGFMITAVDGQLNGGGGADKLRVKIWEKATGVVVYDNQVGASDDGEPTTTIAGGSIVIHQQ